MSPEVTLGLIAAAPPTLLAVASLVTSIKGRADVKDAQSHAQEAAALMKGNGKGTVPVMLERLLDMQTQHEVDDDVRFAEVNARLGRRGK